MSSLPPPFDPSDDADEQYRRASDLDPSRPSEATRRAVLAHAARLAVERARRGAPRWLLRLGVPLSWRPAILGTVAAAVLAGIVIAPQFLAPTSPPESLGAPVARVDQAGPAPAATPAAPPAPGERASAPAPAPPNVMQPVVVTGSDSNRAPRPSRPAAAGGAVAPIATAAASRVAPVRPPQPVHPTVSGDIAAGPDALRRAAAAGDLEALAAQLASGTDIDARDAEGRTALLLATLNRQANAAAVLLAHGADPSAADAHGTTPLQAAIAADERAIIVMLRRYGAR